jgi:hypothetical protein
MGSLETDIFTSVLIVSRKRPSALSQNLSLLYQFADYPDNLECLIRIDDDDPETENAYRNGEFFKSHRNRVRMYKGPRLGYRYIWFLEKQMYELSSGSIIVPFADDCQPFLKGWDSIPLKYKDLPRVVGMRVRLMLTRPAIEKYDILKNFGGMGPGSDVAMFRFASKENIFIDMKKWYKRVQPEDDVQKEGPLGKWKVEDANILKRLKLEEVLV